MCLPGIFRLSFVATLAFGFFVAPADATTINFSGTVTSGTGSISNGDTLTGSLTYDETAVARAGSDSQFAYFDAITAFSFSIGGFGSSLSNPTGASEIQIDNNPGVPNHDRFAAISTVAGGFAPAQLDGVFDLNAFGFRVDDSTDTVFSDALLLPTALSLANFDSGSFFIFFKDSDNSIGGTIDSLETVSSIPLPAGLPLFATGLAGLGLATKRRKIS
ncbi:MAG: VPLPA-CTERM sorting domain-containing protein [Hyphomicrobiales bacterium]